MNEVYTILGEIPPAQSERKFLIEYVDESVLAPYDPVEQNITQTYLKARAKGTERRVRKVVSNNAISYFYCEKRPISPIERIENERLLSQKDYIRKTARLNKRHRFWSSKQYLFHIIPPVCYIFNTIFIIQ